MAIRPPRRALRRLAPDIRDALEGGLTREGAERLARSLLAALSLSAVGVYLGEQLLAFRGAGEDHHRPGTPAEGVVREALRRGEPLGSGHKEETCPRPTCPLGKVLALPLRVQGVLLGALALYLPAGRRWPPHLYPTGILLAEAVSARLDALCLRDQARELEDLRALRAEISPHFVFNTLTVVGYLVERDPPKARALLSEFAEFLRRALREQGEFCTLEEELWFVERYLALEQARLGERLRVSLEVAPEVRQAIIPVLTVQPLVENAVMHGIAKKPGGGRVALTARQEGGELRIRVEDTGVGIPAEQMGTLLRRGAGSGLGIGLYNVDRRLRLIYGEEYGLRLESREGEGTRVEVRIPL